MVETKESWQFAPHVLREYALIADGERGILVGPKGDFVWMDTDLAQPVGHRDRHHRMQRSAGVSRRAWPGCGAAPGCGGRRRRPRPRCPRPQGWVWPQRPPFPDTRGWDLDRTHGFIASAVARGRRCSPGHRQRIIGAGHGSHCSGR